MDRETELGLAGLLLAFAVSAVVAGLLLPGRPLTRALGALALGLIGAVLGVNLFMASMRAELLPRLPLGPAYGLAVVVVLSVLVALVVLLVIRLLARIGRPSGQA